MIRHLEPSLSKHFEAVNEVEKLLRRITEALDADGVPYCVIGGNAVAAWVSTIDPGATRTTKDVDILLREGDLDMAKQAAAKVHLDYYEVLDVPMFLPRLNPNPKTGAHILLAGKRVRETDLIPAPDVAQSRRLLDGFNVVDLDALVRMKLVSNRRRDQVHIEDMLEMNLITPEIENALPDELKKRLEIIRTTP
jgi:hypothetical protein